MSDVTFGWLLAVFLAGVIFGIAFVAFVPPQEDSWQWKHMLKVQKIRQFERTLEQP